MKQLLKKQEGFTLMEMLIVLTIISILILLIFPGARNILQRAQEEGCEARENTNTAIHIANDFLGTTLEQIENDDCN